jgi:hypothetical protein
MRVLFQPPGRPLRTTGRARGDPDEALAPAGAPSSEAGRAAVTCTSAASCRKRATASGRIEYQIQVPRRSPEIQPASRRTFR